MEENKMKNKELVRLTTAGSVDDGKSTLIGRLLYECNAIYSDQLELLEKIRKKNGGEDLDFAFLLDGLSAEQEQGITIDVAYRYFSTDKRKYIIADVPGHEQYTRNMVTGASNAQVALILVDARKGLLRQSKRHLFIASLLGLQHVAIVINKMDLVDYSQAVYDKIKRDFVEFSIKLNISNLTFIPISALKGEMVTKSTGKMPWYKGWILLDYLENIQVVSERNLIDFRLPVQIILRPDQDHRYYAGLVESGVFRKGEEIMILPSRQKSIVKSIILGLNQVKEASAGQSIVFSLQDNIDISRGDIVVRQDNLPRIASRFEASLCWLDKRPLDLSRTYILKHTSKEIRCSLDVLRYRINTDNLHRKKAKTLHLNEIGRVIINTNEEILFDPYIQNKNLGNFILIDEISNNTVAAGVIIKDKKYANEDIASSVKKKGAILWLTGLSGSGKSTIANKVFDNLQTKGIDCEILDGDVIRQNLNNHLGFSKEDRLKNMEIAGFLANMLSKHGVVVIVALISPCKFKREEFKNKFDNFYEIYINASLAVCEQRDVKGLYKKVRQGEIVNFTGIDNVYEQPKTPDLEVKTDKLSVDEAVDKVTKFIKNKLKLFI